MALFFTALSGLSAVVLGYFGYYFGREHNMVLSGLSLLGILLLGIVIGTSFLISTFVVSRTNRIARTARELMETGNLSQRIEIDGKWDDLSYMSGVLNAFLDRNEELVTGIQRVSDNIAHDLRTPLTRLRNNLESLKNGNADATSVERLLAEADQLLSTFNALLRIARIETAQQRHNFSSVFLPKILKDVVELYEPVAEERKIALSLETQDVMIEGDRDLLFQAFANLLDNAVKFSPEGGRVSIRLVTTDNGAICTVRDEGPGIPDNDKKKAFQRFYRADSSRHTPGNGLGLSLVAAVVHLHDGDISLEDAGPGLLVKTTF